MLKRTGRSPGSVIAGKSAPATCRKTGIYHTAQKGPDWNGAGGKLGPYITWPVYVGLTDESGNPTLAAMPNASGFRRIECDRQGDPF